MLKTHIVPSFVAFRQRCTVLEFKLDSLTGHFHEVEVMTSVKLIIVYYKSE